jgi:hypothetical protein
MIKVDLRDKHSMFRRAWLATHGENPFLDLEASRQKWKSTFGCDMVEDETNKFIIALFEREEDYTAFLLRWS